MVLTELIADYLTRIRNEYMVRLESLVVPAYKMKKDISEILKREGYFREVEVIDDEQTGVIRIFLKYGKKHERVISGLKRITQPGLRTYVKSDAVL